MALDLIVNHRIIGMPVRIFFYPWVILIMKADFKVLLVSLVLLSTGVVFIYCYMGTFTTDQFQLYADISYKSMWYKFPVRLQKYYVFILADSQRPRYFNGLGFIDLNLVTFAKVKSYKIGS